LLQARYQFSRYRGTKHSANEAHILIAIDKGEELFSTADRQQAAQFFQLLNEIEEGQLPFVILLALRSDYFGYLQQEPHLLVTPEAISLKPMPIDRVRLVIEGPARVAGVAVDPELTDAAIKDAATDDALPLLAFMLVSFVGVTETKGILHPHNTRHSDKKIFLLLKMQCGKAYRFGAIFS
jgi:conflict system STAND superfamily ATPase